jgi:hypothetical protein
MTEDYDGAPIHIELESSVGPLLQKIQALESVIREIISQIDQGGSGGKVFARDNCIERARAVLGDK